VYSLFVLIPIVLISGEPLTWRWLELLPAIALQSLFCLGLAFFVARIGARLPDFTEVLPFVTRVWMYMSGVMYSVQVVTRGHAAWLSQVMMLNPAYGFLVLARNALLIGNPATLGNWAISAAWAFGTLATGYLFFWRGEEEYGNV
jgi:teichoic acid transport system permease protein